MQKDDWRIEDRLILIENKTKIRRTIIERFAHQKMKAERMSHFKALDEIWKYIRDNNLTNYSNYFKM